jgi:hypothetical protein
MLRPGLPTMALRHIQLKPQPHLKSYSFSVHCDTLFATFVTLQHQAQTKAASAAAAAALASSCVECLAHLANDIKCSGYE